MRDLEEVGARCSHGAVAVQCLAKARFRIYRIRVREFIRAFVAAILGGLAVYLYSFYAIGTRDPKTLTIQAFLAVVVVWAVAEAIQTRVIRDQLLRPIRALDKRFGRPRLIRTQPMEPAPGSLGPTGPPPASVPVPGAVQAPVSSQTRTRTMKLELDRQAEARNYLWALDEVAIELVSKGAREASWDTHREAFVRAVLNQASKMIMAHVGATQRRLGFLECVDAAEKFTPGIVRQDPPAHHHLRLILGPGLTTMDIADSKTWGNDRGLANRAIFTGEHEQEEDCDRPGTQFVPAGHRVVIGSMLCVPARIENMVVGVISADCPRKGAFSPTDTLTMTELATKIALAYATAPPAGQPLRA